MANYKKERYAIGSFTNNYEVTMFGFSYRSDCQLEKKINKVMKKGWYPDSALSPLREVDEIPSYVKNCF